MTFIDDILVSTREAVRLARRDRPLSDVKKRIKDIDGTRDFRGAVSRKKFGPIRLIAEIKKASPSKGILRQSFNVKEIAMIYEDAGASALSVLTEERFFLGSIDNIGMVRDVSQLPVLRKDFLVDEYQIYEARASGADAVLLIARLLDDYQMKDYTDIAKGLGMSCLVEVHSEGEIHRVLKSDFEMIGINNRDLRTFKTDLEITLKLAAEIPHDRTILSESGISSREDVDRLEEAAIDAVLIGETFMKTPDIKSKVWEVMGRPS